MASDDPLRSARLPSREQVIELLTGEFARAGYEIEDVTITAARPPSITVVADGDAPLDLDAVAELSRLASAALDEADRGFDPYVLEVTSRGVDRPLTEEKHFRRAKGRKVAMTLADGSELAGRIGATGDGVVALVVPDGKNLVLRPVAVGEIVKAIVQVEFSKPSRRELELVEQSEEGAGS
ncbi:ribosome maturation factor RimP [Mycolicibacterium neoaurum]|uniref:Ribosome maturation factor RimP n=1 Tax=Mycolicibacterium neoaurum TaxID=1795 RepID=A0AAV2WFZ0_MYCNE|nr:ribosome maturation factor RimP [Mycolicibacterium neoaurum]TLH63501.1 ribosome maturation factor RimP [Mycolicibacterium neoaurum]CDQ43084.1 ribosome maturation factor [Mycolicibacterium neoaurum]SDE35278.1 ribosome maturation factor RimP [Mycolicibacterium neoaurum]